MIPRDGERPTPGHDLQRLIDRLVEGELDGPERRALLLGLEAEPGGWRRCALAFLEAQVWRESLQDLARPTADLQTESPPPGTPRRTGAVMKLAYAAALGAVFALGWTARHWAEPEPSRPVIAIKPAEGAPATGSEIAQAPPAPGLVAEPPSVAEPPAEPPFARLGTADAVEPSREVPASLLSSQIRGQLERRGYQVEQRPAVAAVELDDGRRLAIPVEEVKLRFVGSRMY